MASIASSGQVGDVLGGPVVAVAGRVVDRALEVGVRRRLEEVRVGAELADRARAPARPPRPGRPTCRAIATAGWPCRCSGTSSSAGAVMKAHASESSSGASFITSRNVREDLVGARRRRRAPAAADLGPERVQRQLERGDDAEAAAAAAQRPEQLGVLVLGGAHDPAVPGDELGGDEVVAGQPVLALEPARAAAEREPGDAGGGDAPAGRGEPVRAAWRGRRRPRCAPPPIRAMRARRRPRCRPCRGRRCTMPSSHSDSPATECPPARTAIGRSWSRAKASAAITSSTTTHSATSAAGARSSR